MRMHLELKFLELCDLRLLVMHDLPLLGHLLLELVELGLVIHLLVQQLQLVPH